MLHNLILATDDWGEDLKYITFQMGLTSIWTLLNFSEESEFIILKVSETLLKD